MNPSSEQTSFHSAYEVLSRTPDFRAPGRMIDNHFAIAENPVVGLSSSEALDVARSRSRGRDDVFTVTVLERRRAESAELLLVRERSGSGRRFIVTASPVRAFVCRRGGDVEEWLKPQLITRYRAFFNVGGHFLVQETEEWRLNLNRQETGRTASTSSLSLSTSNGAVAAPHSARDYRPTSAPPTTTTSVSLNTFNTFSASSSGYSSNSTSTRSFENVAEWYSSSPNYQRSPWFS